MPRSCSSVDGHRSAAAVLCLAAAILVWPVILSGAQSTSEGSDQRNYHLPVIETMARQWPHPDIVDYRSTTSPGYHLALAWVYRTLTHRVMWLQLLSSLAGLGLVLAVWRVAAGSAGPFPALALVLPVLGSTYVLGAAIWLTTDDTALFLVALALGGATTMTVSAPRLLRWGAYATAAVFVRQVHLWVVAPLLVAAVRGLLGARRRPGPLVPAAVAAVLGPFMVVGWLAWRWGGLTPPAYRDLHDAGANPANLVLILALFGAFGVFFLPAFLRRGRGGGLRPRGMVAWAVMGAALLLAAVTRSSYDHAAGRWGGGIWAIARGAPAPGGRSSVLVPLAVIGAYVLLRGVEAAVAAGRAGGAVVLLVAVGGWAAAQSVNSMAWQRYAEPMVLITLAWLAAFARAGRHGRDEGRWWIWPLALGAGQLVFAGFRLYAPVARELFGG